MHKDTLFCAYIRKKKVEISNYTIFYARMALFFMPDARSKAYKQEKSSTEIFSAFIALFAL